MNISKPALLEKINTILDDEIIVGYSAEGSPLTKNQYNKRLHIAEEQISSNEYISQEDLENEIDDW